MDISQPDISPSWQDTRIKGDSVDNRTPSYNRTSDVTTVIVTFFSPHLLVTALGRICDN